MTHRLYLMFTIGWMALALNVSGCRRPAPAADVPRVKTEPKPLRRAAPRTTKPPKPRPPVVVELGQADVSYKWGTLYVRCRVTLVNRTGVRLQALSNFNSIYDGFSVIVRGPHGGLVARQSSAAHKSPYAIDRVLPVAPGETTGTLQFPISLKAKPVGPLEVQLTGGIRGTRWSRSLRSNIVVAKWSKKTR